MINKRVNRWGLAICGALCLQQVHALAAPPPPQVAIDVKLVETDPVHRRALGLRPPPHYEVSPQKNYIFLSTVLESIQAQRKFGILESFSDTKVTDLPVFTATPGHQAVIHNYGIDLKFTPTVTPDGSIRMSVAPEHKEFVVPPGNELLLGKTATNPSGDVYDQFVFLTPHLATAPPSTETPPIAHQINPFGPSPGPLRTAAEAGWQGFYGGIEMAYNRTSDDVGVSLGGDWDRIPSRFTDEIESRARHEFDENAFVLGVYAGYLFQFNRLVVGPEIDLRKIWQSEGIFDTEDSVGNFRVRSGFHTNFAMTADARVGYSFGRWLPYFIAGFALSNLHVNQTLSFFEQSGGEIFHQREHESEFQPGWTVGAGFEYALTPNWSLRAQYRYVDFGTINFSSQGTDGFDRFTGQHSAELTEHWADFGVTYRFGGFGAGTR